MITLLSNDLWVSPAICQWQQRQRDLGAQRAFWTLWSLPEEENPPSTSLVTYCSLRKEFWTSAFRMC